MADSIDRVFSHALNTVNKIRTGSEKPPASVRLKLYGLYKQSMEGDVDGIAEKPVGTDERSRRSREKWEAWHAQSGLSRTEAKRRYITTLIETMQDYASASTESRELVNELEFVWDQIKSNLHNSQPSSPAPQTSQRSDDTNRHGKLPTNRAGTGRDRSNTQESSGMMTINHLLGSSGRTMKEREREIAMDGEDEEEFVEASDTLVNESARASAVVNRAVSPRAGTSAYQGILGAAEHGRKKRSFLQAAQSQWADDAWKASISASIIKLTAEVAALREQLEARRLFAHTLQFRVLRSVSRIIWGVIKHVALDIVILCAVLLWLRRCQDRRLEAAVRVLLGDAAVQVQRLGDVRLGNMHFPRLPGVAKKGAG